DLAAPVDTPIVARPIPFFLLAGIALGVVLALGQYTPVYPWLHEFVPGFGRARWPATAGYLIAVHLAALAGVGLEAVRREHRRIRVVSGVALGWGVVTAAFWFLARGPLAGSTRSFLTDGVPPFQQTAWELASGDWLGTLPARAAVLVLAGWLGLALAPIRSRVLQAWIPLLVLELFLVGRSLGMPVARGFYDAPNPRAESLREQIGSHRVYTPRSVDQLGNFLSGCDNPVAFEWARRAMLCNANVPAGIPQVLGCEPLNPRRHEAFTQIFDDPSTPHETRERIFDLWDAAALLQMEGVTPPDVPTIQDPDRGLTVNAHEPRLARVSLVTGWGSADDGPSALQAVLSPEHDPALRTWIEVPAGAVPPADASREPTGPADPVEYHLGPNSVSAAWHVGDGGMLRVLESWAPGWKATANGNPVPVYRADFLFMAVPVPAGSVQLELTYRPDSQRHGAIATLAGLLALILCLVPVRRAAVPAEPGGPAAMASPPATPE
ncbi:MAG TPA: YfhO family protein, partial [bacterium]|nr:YfhO family protein [bacterium]